MITHLAQRRICAKTLAVLLLTVFWLCTYGLSSVVASGTPLDTVIVTLTDNKIQVSSKTINMTVDSNDRSSAVAATHTIRLAPGLSCVSNKPDIANVKNNNTIEAYGYGKAQIKITDTSSKKKATLTVNVYESPAGVTLTGKDTVAPNKSTTLKAAITNTSKVFKDDKTITWSSSDESILVVNQKGKVTGVALGSATVTAETANGKRSSMQVFVHDKSGAIAGGMVNALASKKPLTDSEARTILENVTTPNANRTRIDIGNKQAFVEIDKCVMEIDPNFNDFLKNEMYESNGSIKPENATHFVEVIAAGINKGLKADDPKAKEVIGCLTDDQRFVLYVAGSKERITIPGCEPKCDHSIGHDFLHVFCKFDEPESSEMIRVQPTRLVKALVSKKPLTDAEAKNILKNISTPNGNITKVKIKNKAYPVELDSSIMASDSGFNRFLRNSLYEENGSISPENAQYFLEAVVDAINRELQAQNKSVMEVRGFITADQRFALYLADGKTKLFVPACSPVFENSIGHSFLHRFCKFDTLTETEQLRVQG